MSQSRNRLTRWQLSRSPSRVESEAVWVEPELATIVPEAALAEPVLEPVEREPELVESEAAWVEPEPEVASVEPELEPIEPAPDGRAGGRFR